ncbi:hypothetical protein DMI65_14130 [Escherichia coli]|nr:hypothetical protein [Escherichia coli]
MVGLSCACFCKLNKGGWDGAVITFGQYGRDVYPPAAGTTSSSSTDQLCLTAFAATTISGCFAASHFQQYPTIAMAASVLLLVPGFPLINAVADMF